MYFDQNVHDKRIHPDCSAHHNKPWTHNGIIQWFGHSSCTPIPGRISKPQPKLAGIRTSLQLMSKITLNTDNKKENYCRKVLIRIHISTNRNLTLYLSLMFYANSLCVCVHDQTPHHWDDIKIKTFFEYVWWHFCHSVKCDCKLCCITIQSKVVNWM